MNANNVIPENLVAVFNFEKLVYINLSSNQITAFQTLDCYWSHDKFI